MEECEGISWFGVFGDLCPVTGIMHSTDVEIQYGKQ